MTVNELRQRLLAAGFDPKRIEYGAAVIDDVLGEWEVSASGTPDKWQALLQPQQVVPVLTDAELDAAGYQQQAIRLILQAAGLCSSACGALLDCDEPSVRAWRPDLMEIRDSLKDMGYAMEGERRAMGRQGVVSMAEAYGHGPEQQKALAEWGMVPPGHVVVPVETLQRLRAVVERAEEECDPGGEPEFTPELVRDLCSAKLDIDLLLNPRMVDDEGRSAP